MRCSTRTRTRRTGTCGTPARSAGRPPAPRRRPPPRSAACAARRWAVCGSRSRTRRTSAGRGRPDASRPRTGTSPVGSSDVRWRGWQRGGHRGAARRTRGVCNGGWRERGGGGEEVLGYPRTSVDEDMTGDMTWLQ